MSALFKAIAIMSILLSQSVYAETVKDYVKVCIDNQANRMGPELCECMGEKTKDLSAKEFDFFYGIAAKDQEKVNKGHTSLDANQKVKVMQLSVMGPSKCANESAKQANSSKPNGASSTSGSASSSIESADSTSTSQ